MPEVKQRLGRKNHGFNTERIVRRDCGLHEVPAGAYNIRANGKAAARNTTANIDIVSKEDKPGIDIIIKPGTKKKVCTFPL